MHIGTAGWSLSSDTAASFPGEGTHLQRYARTLACVEIDSSFHRHHRVETYARWASSTPPDFRFAVKVPRAITHEARLRGARVPLRQFVDEANGLGTRLAVLLVQLPPSCAFEARPVRTFFDLLAGMCAAALVCEPRHASWFTPGADKLLAELRVARAAADPASLPAASRPGGWLGPAGDGAGAVLYHRWHGAPRMYWSRYECPWLHERAQELRRWPADADRWCIFDNTAGGGAIPNALALQALLA